MLKIKLFGFLFFCFAIRSFSQVEFEDGYFINRNNQRTECLIKNYSWKNNPSEFTYKLSENGQPIVGKLSDIQEFGINNFSKYVGANVKIDRSSSELSDLKFNRNPVWENERLFLKVLIEGKASLLLYKDGNIERFFFKINDSIEQLIYKKYLGESNVSKTNNAFRQQLWAVVKCGDVDQNRLTGINYNSSDLIKYFKSFNTCSGSEYLDYTNQGKRDFFNLKITSGLNYASLSIIDDYNYPSNDKSSDFDPKADLRIGIELEYILPYNRNKWSVIVEPNFQSYNSTADFKGTTLTAEYNSIEIASGIRYYMFLNQNSSVFINGLIGPSFPINSIIDLNESQDYDVTPSASLNFGLGYNFNRVSAEIRYYKNKDVLNDYLSWSAPFQRISFILGFKIL